MSAILIEADAEGWYESGPVKDVLIKGNTFIDCAYNGGPGHAVIAIHPSNKIIDAERPVHQNIRIEDNTFRTFDYPVLYAKSTAGLHRPHGNFSCRIRQSVRFLSERLQEGSDRRHRIRRRDSPAEYKNREYEKKGPENNDQIIPYAYEKAFITPFSPPGLSGHWHISSTSHG